MAIDWDGSKLKAFRLALQDVYRDYADLEIFLAEDLEIDIAHISENTTIDKVIFRLLQKADKDAVFEAFCQTRPDHPVIAQLQQQPLIKPRQRLLLKADWDNLFSHFSDSDAPYLAIACRYAFKAVFKRSFEKVIPDCPPLNNPELIQALLAKYDDPVLAVRFVERVIVELQRTDDEEDRDLSALEQWRDRIAQQYNVPLRNPEPVVPATCHAYLMVALKERGSEVDVYPELHIIGADNPIPFGAAPTTCAVSQVADQIFQWIKQAESVEAIQRCDHAQVVLELFLPSKLLEADISTDWKVRDDEWEDDEGKDERELETYRRFLVRSLERIRPKFRPTIARKWKMLEQDVNAGNGCSRFRRQDTCLKRGELSALLDDLDATGLKLTAKLPTDSSKRKAVFRDIIEASIPIALWLSDTADADPDTLKAEFDALLTQATLTNFADLARSWRLRRTNSALTKHIRLLCDCPDRFPQLPDPTQDNDLLVAS